ncbi:MAG TPA: hypothetical protein VGD94_24635 [Vicinamibacterales bacterium]
MRRWQGHRDSGVTVDDSERAARRRVIDAATHRDTRWDGTPCDPRTLREELSQLAATFAAAGVSLGAYDDPITRQRHAGVETLVRRRLTRQVRNAIRAHARLETFKRELAAYQAARRRGLRGADLNAYRPAWFAPDRRGRYAWALKGNETFKGLEREYREAWPRSRRSDSLQTAVLTIVQRAIFVQLHPEERDIEWGVPATTYRLATAFVRVYFPSVCATATPKRLKDRRGLKRPTEAKTANR